MVWIYTVRGIWYHHQLNGVGMYIKDKGCCDKAEKYMVFKDGMSIDMTTGSIAGTFWIYIFFTIACYVGIAYGVIGKMLPLIPVCVLVYWIMGCC